MKQSHSKNALTKRTAAEVVPMGDALSLQFDTVANIPPKISLSADKARKIITEILLAPYDVKEVRTNNGRRSFDSMAGYLSEIPEAVITRAVEIMLRCAAAEKWRKIYDGCGRAILEWGSKRYPVLSLAWETAEKMRIRSRAERTLDGLEEIFERYAKSDTPGAAVKAGEILLRATHPAFGAVTEAKRGTERTVVNIQINLAGSKSGTETAPDEAIDAEYH